MADIGEEHQQLCNAYEQGQENADSDVENYSDVYNDSDD